MTNYEFYKEEIEMRYRECTPFALTKQNCIASCKIIDCEECVFSCYNNPETRGLRCGDRKMIWAMQEHVEMQKLTKKERKFCELFEGKDVWIAKDKSGVPYLYNKKPHKGKGLYDEIWEANYHGNTMDGIVFQLAEMKFEFIKWEDEEPWSIDDLLKLEVVE